MQVLKNWVWKIACGKTGCGKLGVENWVWKIACGKLRVEELRVEELRVEELGEKNRGGQVGHCRRKRLPLSTSSVTYSL
jgi:hypothetical protein